MENDQLFMLLLGCKPPGRNTEQHDIFFGIGPSLGKLVNDINAFWPGAGKIHIDAWREVKYVDSFRVSVVPRSSAIATGPAKLFFVNLGGYQQHKFEEQHYTLLTAQTNKAAAIQHAKSTLFFQHNGIAGGPSHIDDKYGLDVDDLFEIEEMLTPLQKEKYSIRLTPVTQAGQDELHLGYLKLSSLSV